MSDVEKFVGRSLPHTDDREMVENGLLMEPEDQDTAHAGLTTTSVERYLRNFLKPRDHVRPATKKGDLATIEQAFWNIAIGSGGLLLVLHAPNQIKPLRKTLKDLGVDARALRKEGRLNLVEVKGAKEARRALHLAAGKGQPVWATYGLASSVQIPHDLALEHAYELDAACVTCNAIILDGWLVTRKSWSHSDTWRLEAAHRGLIRVVDDGLLLIRHS